jgi:ornithine cyclodeaminase
VEGDIQQMPADFAVTELHDVLAGRAPGRTHAEQITVFDSVGFALEDYSALRFMHGLAITQGMGTTVSLIPDLADPKDLFGALRPVAPKLQLVA